MNLFVLFWRLFLLFILTNYFSLVTGNEAITFTFDHSPIEVQLQDTLFSSQQRSDLSSYLINVNGDQPLLYYWTPEDAVDNPYLLTTSLKDSYSGILILQTIDGNGCSILDSIYVQATQVNDINEIKQINISVYPNPTSQELFISSGFNLGMTNIQIFDSLGRLVMDNELEITNTPSRIMINLSKGNYIVKIVSNSNASIVKALVIN